MGIVAAALRISLIEPGRKVHEIGQGDIITSPAGKVFHAESIEVDQSCPGLSCHLLHRVRISAMGVAQNSILPGIIPRHRSHQDRDCSLLTRLADIQPEELLVAGNGCIAFTLIYRCIIVAELDQHEITLIQLFVNL